ncbi:MAG: hypothetical protein IT378_21255 [Sandaracinaceae bacterium]|nr:hypothetical protein [Sandaracinaceae bacterium]
MRAATAILFAFLASGCVRSSFDLCALDPPHPDCLLLDAGPRDASAADASDAGASDASDASRDAGD